MVRKQADRAASRWARLALLVLAATLPACGPYMLNGKVIEGAVPAVSVVAAGDPRLDHPGLSAASVDLTLDPASISPTPLGRQLTDDAGRFAISVQAMGAGGWQEYDVGILCQLKGYRDMWQTLKLPPRNRHLLIVMAPGRGGDRPPTDILKDTLRWKDRMLND